MSIHHHHHAEPSSTLDRAFGFGILLNLGFVAIEAWYGWKVDSLALLADAGHNLSDVAGLVLAWVATVVGRRRANTRNTYGWQRASVLAAFVNALLLLLAMGALAWEAITRLPGGAATDGRTIIWVASIGIVINAATALLFMRNQAHDLNVRGAFLHMAADAAVSAGVVVGGLLYLAYGWGWLDPVLSLAIAAIIVIGSWRLFKQSLHLLFDGVPEHVDPVAVEKWLAALPGVSQVHDLHIWALSTTEVALTAHLVMPGGHPGDAFLEEITEELHHDFQISHPTLQIEINAMSHVCVQTR
jgi:cobalt-zinc-cadmium efflux system protein